MHQHHINSRDTATAAENLFEIEGCKKFISRDQENEHRSAGGGGGATAKQVSPPSATSSPSREFSFAISLNPSATTVFPDKTKGQPPNSFAIDLSPADDIFFHGHLLPLHLLSHLPVSPRSSTNSFESFSLLNRDLTENPKPDLKDDGNDIGRTGTSSINNIKEEDVYSSGRMNSTSFETKGIRNKPKSSSSIFGLIKWRKECEGTEREDRDKSKKKLKFDVSHVLKKYLRMVQPLMFFKGKRDNIHVRRQAHSFSTGSSSMRNCNKEVLRGRRGEYSAPASMRTSPTNSGLLVATTALPSANNSTMEELQAAIQAAIAHCKNSIASEKPFKDDQKQSL